MRTMDVWTSLRDAVIRKEQRRRIHCGIRTRKKVNFFFLSPVVKTFSGYINFSVQCSRVLGTVCHNKQVWQVIIQIRLPAFGSESLAGGLTILSLFCLNGRQGCSCIFQTDPQLLAGESWCLWAVFSFLQTSSSLDCWIFISKWFFYNWLMPFFKSSLFMHLFLPAFAAVCDTALSVPSSECFSRFLINQRSCCSWHNFSSLPNGDELWYIHI